MEQRTVQINLFTDDQPETLLSLSLSVLGIVQKAEEALSTSMGITLGLQHSPSYHLCFFKVAKICVIYFYPSSLMWLKLASVFRSSQQQAG